MQCYAIHNPASDWMQKWNPCGPTRLPVSSIRSTHKQFSCGFPHCLPGRKVLRRKIRKWEFATSQGSAKTEQTEKGVRVRSMVQIKSLFRHWPVIRQEKWLTVPLCIAAFGCSCSDDLRTALLSGYKTIFPPASAKVKCGRWSAGKPYALDRCHVNKEWPRRAPLTIWLILCKSQELLVKIYSESSTSKFSTQGRFNQVNRHVPLKIDISISPAGRD